MVKIEEKLTLSGVLMAQYLREWSLLLGQVPGIAIAIRVYLNPSYDAALGYRASSSLLTSRRLEDTSQRAYPINQTPAPAPGTKSSQVQGVSWSETRPLGD